MNSLSRTLITDEFVNMLCLINLLKEYFTKDIIPLFSSSSNVMDVEGKVYSLNNCIKEWDNSIKYTIDYFENADISSTKLGEGYGF